MDNLGYLLPMGQFAERQKALLELIFGEEWFISPDEKTKDHPAYKRWSMCHYLLERTGDMMVPSDVFAMTIVALDTYPFLKLTEGDTEQLYLGALDNIGDATVQKYIKAEIRKPGPYQDVMVQLYVAAWHKAEGHDVSLVEIDQTSFPDIKINMNIPNIPMLIECKHLRAEGKAAIETRLRRIIKKASSQIKSGRKPIRHQHNVGHEHCFGVLVVDVTDVLNSGANAPTIVQIGDAVNSILARNLYSSVHAVVVVWDTWEGSTARSGLYSEISCKRNTIPFFHPNPMQILPNDHMLPVFNTFIMGYIFAGYAFTIRVANIALTSST